MWFFWQSSVPLRCTRPYPIMERIKQNTTWHQNYTLVVVKYGVYLEFIEINTRPSPYNSAKAHLCVRKYLTCSRNLEKSLRKKHNITLGRNYRNAFGSSKPANEKTKYSILTKIQKWQAFHLQRNYFILFAYGSNWWGWSLLSLKMKIEHRFSFFHLKKMKIDHRFSFFYVQKNENWTSIFHFSIFKKWELNTDFHFFIFSFFHVQKN